MGGKDRLPVTDAAAIVAERVARARAALSAFESATQEEVDEVVTAVGWAIVDPEHNLALAETAVSDTGLGDVAANQSLARLVPRADECFQIIDDRRRCGAHSVADALIVGQLAGV